MSVKEPQPRPEPACDMTAEEWEQHKRWIDEQRVARGEEPLDWRGVRQPERASEKLREYVRSMPLPDA